MKHFISVAFYNLANLVIYIISVPLKLVVLNTEDYSVLYRINEIQTLVIFEDHTEFKCKHVTESHHLIPTSSHKFHYFITNCIIMTKLLNFYMPQFLLSC